MTRIRASLLWALACCATATGQERPPAPAGPREWVAFSADIHITFANGKEARGRRVQDEHGCTRDEGAARDGSKEIALINFETEKIYRLHRGEWTSQPIRVGQMTREPLRIPVSRRADPIEGFDAYVAEPMVQIVRGTDRASYRASVTVIPALNFFRAVWATPDGERRVASHIKVGPQPRGEFLPPSGARVTEQAPAGGFMRFRAIGLRLSFAGRDPFEAVTIEETAFAVKTPSGVPLALVASVDDPAKLVVRIRVLANATGRPGDVRGKLLDDVRVALGSTVATTKLGETLTVTVTRVGGTSAQ